MSRGYRTACSWALYKKNPAGIDDEVPNNLQGRAIVAPQGESVLPIAIGPQQATPFDTELPLRQRRRIRGHEVEIDLAPDAHKSRPDPGRVGAELHRNPPLRPDPQGRHEEDRHEKNTCQVPHVRAQASVSPQNKSILYAPRVLLVKSGALCRSTNHSHCCASGQPFDSRVASPREAMCDRMRTR